MSFKEQSKLIKRIRKKHGLSQKAMALKFGLLSPQFVSNIERQLCGIPCGWLRRLSKLATEDEIVQALLKDYETELREHLR